MNYYQAREIQKDGKGTGLFHYTVMNDGYVMAIGYCSPWEACKDCTAHDRYDIGGYLRNEDGSFVKNENGDPVKCKTCNGTGLVKKENPCPGHATEEEACEHYREYLLDRMVIRGPKTSEWPKEKCEIDGCNEEATYLATLTSFTCYQLCEKHANRTYVSQLFRVGESISSC